MSESGKDSLYQKTVVGVGWAAVTQASRQALQFAISVILARLLTPTDFGLVGMVTVFTGFASLFSELGFGAALIQKERPGEEHYSSVFWLNLTTGSILTVLLLITAPLIGQFYDEPRLVPLCMLVALNFLVAPFSMVQISILRRAMDFRLLALVELVTVFVAGVVAIALAMMGYGVWSLAWQILTASIATAVALWWLTNWRPRLRFDRSAVAELFGFSLNLLGFSAFNYWVRRGDNMLIGRFIGSSALGIYARAYSTMLLPLSQVTSVLGRVMFPALSRVQNDKERAKRIYLRSLAMIALVTFPMMMGLLVVTEHFVLALYGARWVAVIPVLRILCLLGMVQSLTATTGWIFQSQGRTDRMFKWGMGAGMLLIGSILVGVWLGTVNAVAASYAITSGVILLYPAFTIPGKLIDMAFSDVFRAVIGVLGCSTAMASIIWGFGLLIPSAWPHWAHLAVQVPIGVGIYWALVHLLGIQAYQDFRAVVDEQWRRYSKRVRLSLRKLG